MLNEKIIYGDLKLNNILISIDRLDKCLIKLSYSNQFITQSNSITNENSLTTPPEFLKDKKTNIKSDIWSLWVIIYYMLFKEYSYKEKGKNQILKDIELIKNYGLVRIKN